MMPFCPKCGLHDGINQKKDANFCFICGYPTYVKIDDRKFVESSEKQVHRMLCCSGCNLMVEKCFCFREIKW